MISWMQRRRKYLIITIWISTIAFIGAGFVGWGSYDYGSKASAVAKVGNTEVTLKELQNSYSALYSQYNQYFQGKFDKNMAKQLGLEKQAMKQVIRQTMLINFAHDLDLAVTDKEILHSIYSSAAFFKDGKFDKETYINALKGARLSTVEYEDRIRKEMLIKKLFSLLTPITSEVEEETIRNAFFVADKIEYKVLDLADIKVAKDDEKIKKYHNLHKSEYQTQKLYEVELLWHEMKDIEFSEDELKSFYEKESFNYRAEDGSVLSFEDAKDEVKNAFLAKKNKKSALLEYIDFKKGKSTKSTESHTLAKINMQLSSEIMNELDALKNGDILKPKLSGNRFVTVKLLNIIPPREMSFKEAKQEVTAKYMLDARKNALAQKAQSELNNFKGKISDFVSRDTETPLEDLSQQETTDFLNKLFIQQTRRGIVNLGQKDVLYFILEQKLLNTEQENDNKTLIKQSTERLKQTLFEQGLFKLLEVRYPVEVF